jgi:hypothetical protein
VHFPSLLYFALGLCFCAAATSIMSRGCVLRHYVYVSNTRCILCISCMYVHLWSTGGGTIIGLCKLVASRPIWISFIMRHIIRSAKVAFCRVCGGLDYYVSAKLIFRELFIAEKKHGKVLACKSAVGELFRCEVSKS